MAMTAALETPSKHLLTGRSVYLLDDHEVVRRGLRHMLESDGLSIAGESWSAREAVRRIPALCPDLAILDDDLPDGSGAEVCRAITLAGSTTRCVLMTEDAEEAVLIDSILAGARGCLSKQDDSSEQLRLIRRALAGNTAYSGQFQPALLATIRRLGPKRPEEKLLTLTRQEMNTAIRLAKGLTNRQISQQMFLAERTVKHMVSSVLTKLGMTSRSQAAVFIARALDHQENPADGYRTGPFPELIAEVTAALLTCTSEARTVPPTDAEQAGAVRRLADAIAATKTGLPSRRQQLSRD